MTDHIRILKVALILATCVTAIPTPHLTAQDLEAMQPHIAGARTAPLDQPVPPNPAVRLGTLANGLRYFIRENQEPENRAELRLVVNAGSILEDEDQRGLAHFLEHMAFNGTENFEKQELIAYMESIGMRLGPGVNASTSFDETVYQLEVPTDDWDNMTTAFQILEDWAHSLTLDPEEIDMERGVVIEEWRLGQGATSRLRDLQFPVLFSGSQYATRLPIGTLESLETFEHDALVRFYRDWYRPDLMAVIAVGDFEADEIEDLVREHFDPLENPTPTRERIRYPIPPHSETLVSVETDPEMTVTSVRVYQKLPSEDDWTVGGYRRRIIEGLYTGMLNNRYGEITTQADPPFLRATSSYGNLIRSMATYTLGAMVVEDGILPGLESLKTEAERVALFGFTASELERQKANLMRRMEESYANRVNRDSGAIAREYTRAYLSGESIPGIEYEYVLHERFVPEISIDEVNRVGRDWAANGNRVVVVSAPERDGLSMPSESDLVAVLESASDSDLTPYVDEVINQPLMSEIPDGSSIVSTRVIEGDITEWELANGVRVALKPTLFDEEAIVFRGFSHGGSSLSSDEDYVPASTADRLVASSGLGDFRATDLEKVLAGRIANVRPFISIHEEGVTGNASAADLETMFQLIYLWFTAPRSDETVYELWRSQMRQALQNRDANPLTAFSDAFTRIITSDHPRLRPPTLAILNETDLAASLDFYKDRFSDAGDYTFVFVGDIDLDAMRPLVERYLGALPSTGREETWRDIGLRPPQGVFEETVYRGIEPRSQTRLAFTGPFAYGEQSERSGIRGMALILETRLRDRLREELGGTYSINVGVNLAWQPTETYTVSISFGSAPDRVEELVGSVLDEIEVLQTAGPTPDEVASTQETMLRSFETAFQENRTVLGQLASDYQRGDVPGASIRTYPESVETMTPMSIQEDAHQYFNMENRIRVTLMPEQ